MMNLQIITEYFRFHPEKLFRFIFPLGISKIEVEKYFLNFFFPVIRWGYTGGVNCQELASALDFNAGLPREDFCRPPDRN